ncbi:MAG: hypothetical protein ACXVGH_03070 [Mycobacteriales bacterium]
MKEPANSSLELRASTWLAAFPAYQAVSLVFVRASESRDQQVAGAVLGWLVAVLLVGVKGRRWHWSRLS